LKDAKERLNSRNLCALKHKTSQKGTRGKMIIDRRTGNFLYRRHNPRPRTLYEEHGEHERWMKKGTIGKVMVSRWMENETNMILRRHIDLNTTRRTRTLYSNSET